MEAARAVRPAPRDGFAAAAGAIREARATVARVPARADGAVSPTALESFLQCPFQYFAGRLLRLKGAPARPEERLDFLTQGGIVHEVLADVVERRGRTSRRCSKRCLRAKREEKHIPISYQTERARNAMLHDLRKFAANDDVAARGVRSRTELEFEFALNESVAIRGKIDRLDVARDGRAVVIDYKYSNAQRTKAKLENENLLQAPLYLMAAERAFGLTPAGDVLRRASRAEWSTRSGATAGDWVGDGATERTLRVVEEIRGGRVEVGAGRYR